MKIASAGNTIVPVYLSIKELGYSITVKKLSDGESLWSAIKDDYKFIGNDPLEVLALIKMHEVRGDSWQASDSEIENFLDLYEKNS